MKPELSPLNRTKEPTLSPDFQDNVLHRINRHHRRKQTALNVGLFCLIFVISFQLRQRNDSGEKQVAQQGRAESAKKGVAWLVKSQNPDGTWQNEDWGGHPSFNQGTSALATLALLQAPDPVPRDIIEKAVTSLEASFVREDALPNQAPQLYNTLLTLNTLLNVEKFMPDPHRRLWLEERLVKLIRTQQADGGWGYNRSQTMGYGEPADANSAVTWWMCYLLEENPTLNLPGAEQALERGKAWLASRRLSTGEIAYQEKDGTIAGPESALFWMSALMTPPQTTEAVNAPDAYRDYFRLTAQPDPHSFKNLQQEQLPGGEWENPNDRWWRAGGKVYLTALSVLAQVPKGA